MTPARHRPTRLYVLVPLLATAAALIAAEGALRIIGTPARDQSRLLTEHDATLGWRKKPLTRHAYRTSEYSVIVSTNSQGLRGPEHPVIAPAGTYRILLLGDSFAEGYTAPYDSTAGKVMERLLNAAGNGRHEVINAGTAGYSTDQELLYFREYGRRYKPNLVMLTFYVNDVMFNSRARYWRGFKPLFRPIGDSLELLNVPVPKPGTSRPATDPRISRDSWLSRHSRLHGLARAAIERSSGLTAFLVRLGIEPVPDDWRPWMVSPDSALADAWNTTEALLVRFKQEVNANGAHFVVFYVPSRAAVYPRDWSAMKATYGLTDDRWSPAQDHAMLAGICRRGGIDCVDNLGRFRKEAASLQRSGQRLYFAHDVHWNTAGHRLGGSLMAEHVATIRER